MVDQSQHCRLPRVGQVGQLRGHAVRGHGVLGQVISTNRHKPQVRHDLIGHQGGGRHLNHGTGGQAPLTTQAGKPLGLPGGSHHGCHDPGWGSLFGTAQLGSGLSNGIELAGQKCLIGTGHTQTAHAQSRVHFVGHGGKGHRLIRTSIQGANHNLGVRELLQHLLIDLGLLLD